MVGDAFALERHLVVLRGKTGTGKTAILRGLHALGAQVLDLEELAGHRGSAFGGLGLAPQPSHDQFQQRVAAAWSRFTADQIVWCEHEAQYLGGVGIPTAFQARMHQAAWIELVSPPGDRVERIVEAFAGVSNDDLAAAARRLRRRVGRQRSDAIERWIREGRIREAVAELLPYYDAAYEHQLAAVARRPLARFELTAAR